MKRKTIKRIIFIPLGIIVLLIGITFAGVALILTPKRLTPLVSEVCDRYLDAQVKFDTVNLFLFRDFPFVTLRLRGAEVISHAFTTLPDSLRSAMPSEADTLARVGLLDVSLNPWDIISGKVDIRRVRLDNAHLHAYVAPNGRANWDIYQSDTTTTQTESTDLEININRIAIQEGLHLVYNSSPDKMIANATLQEFTVRGRLTTDLLQNDIQRLRLLGCSVGLEIDGAVGGFTLDSLAIDGERQVDYLFSMSAKMMRWDDTQWVDSLQFQGGILFHGKEHKDATISDFGLRINDMLVTAGGDIGFHNDSITTDIGVQTKNLKLASILNLIPTKILPLARDYETDLAANLNVRVDGVYNPTSGTLPDVTADVRIPAGYLYYTKARIGGRIDKLALDATMYYRPQNSDSTSINIRELQVAGIGMNIEANGRATNLTGDAMFDGTIKGGLSLDHLTLHFPSPEGTIIGGRVAMDVSGDVRLSQLNLRRIGSANLQGIINVDTLRMRIPGQDFRLMVGSGKIGLGVGTVKSDSATLAKGTQAVGATFALDTINMNLGRDLYVAGRSLRVHATTSTQNLLLDTTSTAIHPLQGVLSATGLRVEMGESTVFVGRSMETKWSLIPIADNSNLPHVALQIRAQRLSFREAENRFSILQGDVRLDLAPYKSLRTRVRDTTARRSKRDVVESDIDMQLSSDMASLLRKWQLSGTIKASRGRVLTPYFPMNTIMRDMDITFNTNDIHLNRTFIKSGESEMVITGAVLGLRRALLRRETVRGSLKIDADTLNLNEIIRVANAGFALMAEGGVEHTDNDDQMEQRITQMADTSSVGSTLLIPNNIDMTFDMRVHHGAYANISLDSVSGKVIARNRMLELSQLVMQSDAGNIKLTGIYATRTPQDIQMGLDLEMDNMQIEKLVELIPSVDTLMPMLKSFEGVVNCQIAVTARLDSTMNVLLPSITAACHIGGSNLVVMDGETFTEISKMLMFKNKKRNVIEHLSANILVRNSQVEVFPFVVEIDRYRVAISGVNDLDMKFNYHISVLKSPIPFRLGVDIFGDMNDFDFKIRRARYKSADNLPTNDDLIKQTRSNLQNYIRNISAHGIEKATDISALDIIPETKSPIDLLPPSDSLNVADTVGLYKVVIAPF